MEFSLNNRYRLVCLVEARGNALIRSLTRVCNLIESLQNCEDGLQDEARENFSLNRFQMTKVEAAMVAAKALIREMPADLAEKVELNSYLRSPERTATFFQVSSNEVKPIALESLGQNRCRTKTNGRARRGRTACEAKAIRSSPISIIVPVKPVLEINIIKLIGNAEQLKTREYTYQLLRIRLCVRGCLLVDRRFVAGVSPLTGASA